MREKNIADIINKLKTLFTNRIFVNHLKDARNNWLGVEVDEVLKSIYNFLESVIIIST